MKFRWCLPLLVVLFIVGCRNNTEAEAQGPLGYYLSDLEDHAGGDAICAVPVELENLENMDTREAVGLLLDQLSLSGEGYTSPLPSGVKVSSVLLHGRRAYVDMSRGSGNLTGVELSLADYCITLTLCQLEEIASVIITAGGQPVFPRSNQVLMEQDVLFSGMEDVVSTVVVRLWFLDKERELSLELRELELHEGQTLAEAAADALAEGPRDRDHSAVLPQGFTFRSIWMEGEVCYVNIPGESIETLPEEEAKQEQILRAISQTFFSLDTVRELRFLVDSNETETFGLVSVKDYSRPAVLVEPIEDEVP